MRQFDLSLWILPPNIKKPTAIQIEEFIKDRIIDGIVKPFEDIPAHRLVAQINAVNRNTALRAYTRLIANGWLTHRKGSTTRVAELRPGNQINKPTSMPELLPVPIHYKNGNQEQTGEKKTSFVTIGACAVKQPSAAIKLAKSLNKSSFFKQVNKPILSSTDSYSTIKEEILKQLTARKFKIHPEQFLLVRGRTEALITTFKTIAKQDSILINTAPNDHNINWILNDYNIRHKAMSINDELIKQLETMLIKTKICAIYLRSNCSYPECRNLDEATAQKLIALAIKHQFYIIEEDDEHELWWGKLPPKPLAHYNHLGVVLYIAAVSQLSAYMQHLRTIIAPTQFIDLIQKSPTVSFGYIDLAAEKEFEFLSENGNLLSCSRKMRLDTLKDLTACLEILEFHLAEFTSYERAESGTGIWLTLKKKINLSCLVEIIAPLGLSFIFIAPELRLKPQLNHIKLEFANMNPNTFRKFSIHLRDKLKKTPRYG